MVGGLLGFCLGAFAVGVGLRVDRAEAGGTLERKAFDEAVDLVLDRYVDPVDANALLARGLRHMVAGLDAHSVYLDSAARDRLAAARRSGRVVGIHLESPLPGGEGWRVDSVVPGSPADEAGLREGESLLKIGGQPASDFVHALEAMLALRAPGSDTIELVVRDAHGITRGVSVRSQVQPKTYAVESRLWRPSDAKSDQEAKIGVITIHVFAPGVGDQVGRALRELHRAAGGQLEGLVLDLRGNPGGEVDEALIVAELFIADGILTRTRGRGGKILREEHAHRRGTDERLPVAVLQDASSASASELLAAALQSHGRATIYGTRSYGKGTVQNLHGLADGSQLRLTVARYYDAKDRLIDGVGVQPDVRLGAMQMRAPMRETMRHFGRELDALAKADYDRKPRG